MGPSDNDFDPELDDTAPAPLSRPQDSDVQMDLLREAFVEQGKMIGELSRRVDGILNEIQVVKAALNRHRAVLHKILAQLNLKHDNAE